MNFQVETGHIDARNGNVQIGEKIVTNIYRSADWQDLLEREQNFRDDIEAFEEAAASSEKARHRLQNARNGLTSVLQQQEDFKRDTIKLAEDFQRIPLDTERLRKAFEHFQKGDFREARAVLDTEAMRHDQDRLLARKQDLAQQTAENAEQLKHNAQEWLLQARLTAIDYSLKEQRIPQTCAAFECALESDNSADNLFLYADFLRENNQYQFAEQYYLQALTAYYHQQMTNTPNDENQKNIAATLNNLAVVLDESTNRYNEAEKLYKKALAIRRKLAKKNPDLFKPTVAMTLNNLALLIAKNPIRRNEAEKLHQKALAIRRKLAKENPEAFEPKIAMTLNNLAILIKQNPNRHSQAEKLYQEALQIYRKLAKKNPDTFEQDVAMVLNNLAILLRPNTSRHSEAEIMYQEALSIRRRLAKKNPDVFEPKVAMTLTNWAVLIKQDTNRYSDAEVLLQEALLSYRKLTKNNPDIFMQYLAEVLNNLALLFFQNHDRRSEAETLYQEALSIRRGLAERNPQVFQYKVAETLFNIGLAYLDWQHPVRAQPLFEEAATLISPYATDFPERFGELQQKIQNSLAKIP